MHNVLDHFFTLKDLYGRFMAPVCKKHGLTRTELDVLLFLANNPAWDTASQIAARQHITKSHVSISVRGLQERGLLSGRHLDSDRRTVHLKLEAAAEPAAADGKAAQSRFFEAMLEGFSPEDWTRLQAYIGRINDNLRKLSQSAEGPDQNGTR